MGPFLQDAEGKKRRKKKRKKRPAPPCSDCADNEECVGERCVSLALGLRRRGLHLPVGRAPRHLRRSKRPGGGARALRLDPGKQPALCQVAVHSVSPLHDARRLRATGLGSARGVPGGVRCAVWGRQTELRRPLWRAVPGARRVLLRRRRLLLAAVRGRAVPAVPSVLPRTQRTVSVQFRVLHWGLRMATESLLRFMSPEARHSSPIGVIRR